MTSASDGSIVQRDAQATVGSRKAKSPGNSDIQEFRSRLGIWLLVNVVARTLLI